jgi:UDP-glucose 4-epimerase
MNVLVVGGAGYVGSVVAEELVRARHATIVLDDLSTGHKDAVPALSYLVEGGMEMPGKLEEALGVKEIDCVIHLAGKSLVEESVRDPELYRRANVEHGIRLLDAMEARGVRRIVFSSTAAVYDPEGPMPLDEDAALRPANPYGESKLRFEEILRSRSEAGTLRFVALRYFNVAGASIDHGEDHREETHLIPRLLDAARGAREAVPVYGTDYPTPDGTPIRDYVHVLDVASAHLRAMDHLAQDGSSAVLNLGSERGYSVREVIRAAETVTGRPVPVREQGRRAGDPARLIASAAAARRVLGWRQDFGDLETILETAWTWRQRYPEGYRE